MLLAGRTFRGWLGRPNRRKGCAQYRVRAHSDRQHRTRGSYRNRRLQRSVRLCSQTVPVRPHIGLPVSQPVRLDCWSRRAGLESPSQLLRPVRDVLLDQTDARRYVADPSAGLWACKSELREWCCCWRKFLMPYWCPPYWCPPYWCPPCLAPTRIAKVYKVEDIGDTRARTAQKPTSLRTLVWARGGAGRLTAATSRIVRLRTLFQNFLSVSRVGACRGTTER